MMFKEKQSFILHKAALIIFLASIKFNSPSQGIVLTYNNFVPVPGENYIYYNINADNIAVDSGGANCVWDYSKLVLSLGHQIDSFFSPETTTCFSIYPNSTVARNGYKGISYLTGDSNKYAALGTCGSDTRSKWIESFLIMSFPFKYRDTVSDRFYLVNLLNNDTLGDIIIANIEADGWGKLILPGCTFERTLRIKSHYFSYDTSNKTIGSITNSRTFSWYDGQHKNCLLEIGYRETMLYNPFDTLYNRSKYGIISECYNVFLPENIPLEVMPEIFPNPAKDRFVISYNSTEESILKVEAYSLFGRQLNLKFSKRIGIGKIQEEVHLDSMPAGVYMVKISIGKETYYKKIVVY